MEYQLLKYLYSTTSNLIKERSDKVNDNFEKADRIIIWIVGFSIGVFVLILTRKSDNILVNSIEFEILIISLIVVIFGLLFRIISFFTQMKLNDIIVEFLAYTTGFTNSEKFPSPRNISEEDTLEDIIFYLEQDFFITKTPINTSKFSATKLKEYRDLYKEYYLSLADSNRVNDQMKEYSSELSERFGLDKKAIENTIENKESNKRKGKVFQTMLRISYGLFFITILTFIVGIGFIAFKLIENNCS